MNGIQVDVGLERLIQGAVLQPCQVNQQTDILCTLAGWSSVMWWAWRLWPTLAKFVPAYQLLLVTVLLVVGALLLLQHVAGHENVLLMILRSLAAYELMSEQGLLM